MAMPPGNVVVSDKIQFPAGGGGGGGSVGGGNNGGVGNEIHQQQHHHRHQWLPVDERDGFISWLRGEFAAANAIIDSLCHHLRASGEPGEYDVVIGCIQQRRCNWNPVLHMQHYFSIGEVILALQQVAVRRQQQQHRYYYDQPKVGVKEFKRNSSAGFNKGQRGVSEIGKEVVNNSSTESHVVDGNSSGNVGNETLNEIKSGCENGKLEDKSAALAENKKGADLASKPHTETVKSSGNSEGTFSGNFEAVNERSSPKENDSDSIQNQNLTQNLITTPKTFVGTEMSEGKMVNVVDGLKLYEQFLDNVEVSKLISLVNDLRNAGRKGQFQGQTYVVSKRPMKGHGREMIQLGLPIADAPAEEESAAGNSKERKIESIPPLLQEIIERFFSMQIMTTKLDSCIIDIYNEGDHSQPCMWPPWYGKPISVVFLTECEMTFGRIITADHPGDYRGSLRLSLAPGSLLVMQGKSTDFAKHAIPAIRKQRILLTFAKLQPKRYTQSDGQRLTSPSASLSSHWGPPQSRSPNHIRHPVPKHYAPIPTTGVLPAPSIRPQIPPQNVVQPLFVTAPVAAPMPFPAPVPIPPVSTGWTQAPRHPPNRLPVPVPVPVPGTGVFLPPPGSGNAVSQMPNAPEMNIAVDTVSVQDKESGLGKTKNGTCTSPQEKMNHGMCASLTLDGKNQGQDCNGTADGKAASKDEHQQSIDHTGNKKSAGSG